jgi:hypothetical protein
LEEARGVEDEGRLYIFSEKKEGHGQFLGVGLLAMM